MRDGLLSTTLLGVSNDASWIAVVIGALALVVSYLSYRRQRGRSRLEYVVLTNTRVIAAELADDLQVSHNGQELIEPALSVVRIVNTGERSIKPADFESDLMLMLEGASALASATWTKSRPADLQPAIRLVGNRVEMAPTLINSGDGMQLQILSAGQPRTVTLAGRVADVEIVQRPDMPYPPGSGSEGEMLPFDRFMWFFFVPGGILGIGVALALAGAHG